MTTKAQRAAYFAAYRVAYAEALAITRDPDQAGLIAARNTN